MGEYRSRARTVTIARVAIYSAVISVLTFIAGVGLITWRTASQRDATCDLVRSQIAAYQLEPSSVQRNSKLDAWVRFGQKQHCI